MTSESSPGPVPPPVSDRVLLASLEAVANGVVLTDRDGSILWVNAAFTRMTGYSLAGVAGRTPRLLRSGAHDAAFYERLWPRSSPGRSGPAR